MAKEKEIAFWRAWLEVLRGLTIVDPACGSGAFLIAAFDALAQEYEPVLARLDGLGAPAKIDAFDEIVTKNLFGVDLNPESVEIARLSLWLKTARRGHRLQSLDTTIRVGDSLIEDGDFTSRPFEWREAFPQVFARGGFDIVIGNPPYVRMELIKAIKPYLAKRYAVYKGSVDLYAYFYERGVKLLGEGGRLGFISSSTFFRTGSGENLRVFLADGVQVETVVDFGDLQVFEGVTTYPALVTLKRGGDGKAGDLAFVTLTGAIPNDLGLAFSERAMPMRRARLGAGSWQFEDVPLARLRDKIAKGRKTLEEVHGAPLYGIKTGLNDAFVIDTPTRDRLIAADPKSADLLKPLLLGEDVKRWCPEPKDLWIIFTNQNIDIDDYSAVNQHLLSFKDRLEPKPGEWKPSREGEEWPGRKAGSYRWFELQDTVAYWQRFTRPKIIFSHFMDQAKYAFDVAEYYIINKAYFIPDGSFELTSLLNSKISWFMLRAFARIKRGGYIEAEIQYVSRLPIPAMASAARARLSALGQACTDAARERFDIQSAVRRRILDLAPRNAPG